jgi:hypothetical protein
MRSGTPNWPPRHQALGEWDRHFEWLFPGWFRRSGSLKASTAKGLTVGLQVRTVITREGGDRLQPLQTGC